MPSQAPLPPGSNGAAHGLPPVAPPSGRFIVQLFLVPGLIVAVAVFIYLGSSYLVQSSHTPDNFLKDLDSPNPEIRWRGAHDLAQVFKRPESLALASDPKFALDLAERVARAAAEVEKAEQSTAEDLAAAEKAAATQGRKLSDGERDAFWRKLAHTRHHLLYLTSCLGDFTVPIGAPVLGELALKDRGPEIKGLTARRRRAVWALGNLGNNIKRRYWGENASPLDKVLTPQQKEEIVARLQEEAGGSGQRAQWARQALAYLQKDRAGGLLRSALTGVDTVLARCALADDPFLREEVALALNFWDGPWVEPTLLRLTHDDGSGRKVEVTEAD
jgi:hypothetical protein